MVSKINWHWKDDGGVVLGGDAVESLQISQLKQKQNIVMSHCKLKRSELVCSTESRGPKKLKVQLIQETA